VLDVLEEAGYLNQTRRAKSVTLTKTGLEHAYALAARFLDTPSPACWPESWDRPGFPSWEGQDFK